MIVNLTSKTKHILKEDSWEILQGSGKEIPMNCYSIFKSEVM